MTQEEEEQATKIVGVEDLFNSHKYKLKDKYRLNNKPFAEKGMDPSNVWFRAHSLIAYGSNMTECSSRLFTQKNAIVIESTKCGLEWETNVSL